MSPSSDSAHLSADVIPQGKVTKRGPLFQVPAPWMTIFASLCPFLGLLSCFLIAAIFHAEDTTWTHCRVYNFMPSVSAAIGNNAVERVIWKLAVAAHNIFTILDSFIMYANLRRHGAGLLASRFCFLTKVFCCLALYLLTFVSSTESMPMHATGFICWLVFGSVYQVRRLVSFLRLLVLNVCSPFNSSLILSSPFSQLSFLLTVRSLPDFKMEPHASRFIFWSYFVYFACFPLAIFWYWLHHETCWPYLYSLFGLTEFVLIVAYIFGAGWGHMVVFGFEKWHITVGPLDEKRE